MAHSIFEQVGYIINQYVPEIYQFELFKNQHIIAITDHTLKSVQGFDKYINLKRLESWSFNGDLEPLKGLALQEIDFSSFTGSLEPLAYMSLRKIYLRKYNGEIVLIAHKTLEELTLVHFKGDLQPLAKTQIKKLRLWDYAGSLDALDCTPLEEIEMVCSKNARYYGLKTIIIKRNENGQFKNLYDKEIIRRKIR